MCSSSSSSTGGVESMSGRDSKVFVVGVEDGGTSIVVVNGDHHGAVERGVSHGGGGGFATRVTLHWDQCCSQHG